jgi:zinc and cadmium transporter
VYNVLSSITTIPAALISYFILGAISFIVPYTLAISAASFLCIALSDLIPELHKKWGLKHTVKQLILILAGVFIMILIFVFIGHNH